MDVSPPRAGAVVVGGYVNGLGVARAFAERGHRVAIVTTKPFDIAHRSRAVSEHERVPDLHESPEALIEVLARRSRDWRGRWVVPANDEALAALALRRDGLDGAYRLAVPSEGAARHLLDKRLMHRAAAAIGLDVPQADPPGFPVVVKPVVASRFVPRFGTKVGVARDAAELTAWRERAGDIETVVHDLVPGADDAIVCHAAFLDERGAPRAGVTVRKLRQSPPGFGDARVAELLAPDPALHEATVELARHIGLTGIAVTEFKRDARDGTLRFLEVNGRSVVYNALLRRGGLDLAALVAGDRPPPAATAPGAAWVHLHPDVLYSLRDRIGLRAFSEPYRRRPLIEAVWTARDPLPFLAQWARPPRRGTSRSVLPGRRGR